MSSLLPERTNADVFQQTEESTKAEDIEEPQRTPAEGKAILKQRHKSADESQRQLKPLHSHSMSGPHKTLLLMSPTRMWR